MMKENENGTATAEATQTKAPKRTQQQAAKSAAAREACERVFSHKPTDDAVVLIRAIVGRINATTVKQHLAKGASDREMVRALLDAAGADPVMIAAAEHRPSVKRLLDDATLAASTADPLPQATFGEGRFAWHAARWLLNLNVSSKAIDADTRRRIVEGR